MSLTVNSTHPVSLHGGTFNNVAGNLNIVFGDNGLDLLQRRVLEDAMHNSAERPPEPACHPGTRESVLHTLRAWSRDDSPDARLLWLYGSAGMGKSAIAQTLAAECQEDRILGASFFFRRGNMRRGNWKGLFPTLAYQLAAAYPELGNALRQAIERDRLVFGQAMRHQFQKLIVAPFEQSPQLAVRPIIVLDGLDECEDRSVQVTLLNLIVGGLRTGVFPVRVLLASRPEAHLREVLGELANLDVCRHVELHPDPSAYADIHQYLCDEFSRIREWHIFRGVFLGDGWPGEGSINHLVNKSSGTFIYATTVVRYVADEYSHPAERLNSVMALDPHSTAPLDTLYTQILSNGPNKSILRRVLHAVLGKHLFDWNPEVIDCGLNVPAGTSRLALRSLHSLLYVPPVRFDGCDIWTEKDQVRFLHASLHDFLRDPARSLNFFIDTAELDSVLVRNMAAFLSSSPTNRELFHIIAEELITWEFKTIPNPPTDVLLPIFGDVDVQQVAYRATFRFKRFNISSFVDWVK
ncbi:hypothetical protein C8R47DRAFT_606871 [Mycena vitilis]|nr:hypothetical protein C8R47DRAFT_606871 [Mycena vitilis]